MACSEEQNGPAAGLHKFRSVTMAVSKMLAAKKPKRYSTNDGKGDYQVIDPPTGQQPSVKCAAFMDEAQSHEFYASEEPAQSDPVASQRSSVGGGSDRCIARLVALKKQQRYGTNDGKGDCQVIDPPMLQQPSVKRAAFMDENKSHDFYASEEPAQSGSPRNCNRRNTMVAFLEDKDNQNSPVGASGASASLQRNRKASQRDSKMRKDNIRRKFETAPPSRWTNLRKLACDCIHGLAFQCTIGVCIMANGLVIGFETDMPGNPAWQYIEIVFMCVFTLELTLRLLTYGFAEFFDINDPDFVWNFFDFAIVWLGLIDFTIEELGLTSGHSSTSVFRLIRLLRILRIFKIVRFLKQLYMLAYGFLEASKAVFWVTVLMMFVLYICSVVLVRTVGRATFDSDQGTELAKNFSSIPKSMLTLFNLMSSPNLIEWDPLLNDVPALCGFMVLFIIFGSFGMIALLTGVISESMFEKNQMRVEETRKEREMLHSEILEICLEMFAELELDNSDFDGEIRKEDVIELIPSISQLFHSHLVEFADHDLVSMMDLLDLSGTGYIRKTDFCKGILFVAEGIRPIKMLEIVYAVRSLHEDVLSSKSDIRKLSRKLCGAEYTLVEEEKNVPWRSSIKSAAPAEAWVCGDQLQEDIIPEDVAHSSADGRGQQIEESNEVRRKSENVAVLADVHTDQLGQLCKDVEVRKKSENVAVLADVHTDQLGQLCKDVEVVSKLQGELVDKTRAIMDQSNVMLEKLDANRAAVDALRESSKCNGARTEEVKSAANSFDRDNVLDGDTSRPAPRKDSCAEQLLRQNGLQAHIHEGKQRGFPGERTNNTGHVRKLLERRLANLDDVIDAFAMSAPPCDMRIPKLREVGPFIRPSASLRANSAGTHQRGDVFENRLHERLQRGSVITPLLGSQEQHSTRDTTFFAPLRRVDCSQRAAFGP